MGVASLRAPTALLSATDAQYYVATVAGHWQLVLDLIDAGIEPGLPHKIRHLRQMCLPLGHLIGQEQNLFS